MGEGSKRVRLNVGGVKHEVLWSTLERFPNSRLGRLRHCNTHKDLLELCDGYSFRPSKSTDEFYFDRHPSSFESVLNFYRTGKLHLTDEICVLSFADDLKYWSIDVLNLEPCCQQKFYQTRDQQLEEMNRDRQSLANAQEASSDDESFSGDSFSRWRHKVWDLLEKPQTSLAARVRYRKL